MGDRKQMSCTAAIALCMLFSGCEVQSGTYATWQDAERAELVSKGWIPTFVPRSARDIYEQHDLDINSQFVEFTVPVRDIADMIKGRQKLSQNDQVREISMDRGVNWFDETDGTIDSYAVCTEWQPAVLFVDRKTGRAVFSSTGTWLNKYCKKP